MVVVDRHLVGGREDGADADLTGRRAHARPQRRGRAALVRQAHALVGDVVEQDHLPDLGPMRRDVGPRSAQRARREPGVGAARALLLAVEEHEADLAAGAGGVLEIARQLDHRGRARGAVVGADEALGVVLAVVVGADDDGRRRAPGSSPRCCAGAGGRAASRSARWAARRAAREPGVAAPPSRPVAARSRAGGGSGRRRAARRSGSRAAAAPMSPPRARARSSRRRPRR